MKKDQFRNAVLLALSIGFSAPAASVWAEEFIKLGQAKGVTIDLPLKQFPGDHFTPVQLRNFHSNRITTAGELIKADPKIVGRILGLDPRQAKMTQRHLRESLKK